MNRSDDDDDRGELDRAIGELQRRKKGREPARMGDVVNRLIAQRGYLQTLNAEQLREIWATIAGEQLAAATLPGNVRRGVLEVFATDSCVIQELTFGKSTLLKKLRASAPELKIRDLKFRVGRID